MDISAKIEGLDQIIAKLDAMGGKWPSKVIRATLGKLSTPIRAAFRKNAPVNSGALKESFIKKNVVSRYGDSVFSYIGVSGSYVKQNARVIVSFNDAAGTQYRTVYRDQKPILYAMQVEKYSGKNAGWMKQVWQEQLPHFYKNFNRIFWEQFVKFAAKKAAKDAAIAEGE